MVLVRVQTVYQAEHEIMWQVLLSPFRDQELVQGSGCTANIEFQIAGIPAIRFDYFGIWKDIINAMF